MLGAENWPRLLPSLQNRSNWAVSEHKNFLRYNSFRKNIIFLHTNFLILCLDLETGPGYIIFHYLKCHFKTGNKSIGVSFEK